jgi:hypothetical protein
MNHLTSPTRRIHIMRTLLVCGALLIGACTSQPPRVDCTAHLRPINPPARATTPISGVKPLPAPSGANPSTTLSAGGALEPESGR